MAIIYGSVFQPDIQLTILVGNYAQRYYLHQKSSAKLTDTVKHYKDYLPEFFPLPLPLLTNSHIFL